MKEQLKHLLRKWPALYNLVAKIYSNLNLYLVAEHIVGTRAREREWATRHRRKGDDWGKGSKDWIKSYWDSRNHPHRPLLIEAISKLNPSSILEIGCNCGPNLWLLAKKFPDAEIRGIDINPVAIQKGNELFAAEGILNVKLSVGKADELKQFRSKSFDVVFTDAVLIYIGRDKIRRITEEMVRVTREGLFLVEWHCFEPEKQDPNGLGVRYHHFWKRDYIALLKQVVPEEQIHVTKITEALWPDKNWQEVGAIIKVTL